MPGSRIDFSIVTPSFNMLRYLKRGHASVADQEGAAVEHIIVDGMSSDGTAEWLRSQSDVFTIIEPDRGMYDAINKGMRRARGQILAYLNCDEQYLPGTLARVKSYLDAHPDTDILFGNHLVVRDDGSLICYRKTFVPKLLYITTSHLYAFSCTMFFRRRIIEEGLLFNSEMKAAGDEEFVARVLRRGFRATHVNHYLAVFTESATNLGKLRNAAEETKELRKANRLWVKLLTVPLGGARYVEKLLRGTYHEHMPLTYAVYLDDDLTCRHTFTVERGSFLWRHIPPSR
jgi:glycosyltransferase involved in cell wall biosynthesis